jgi:putative glutamine amidotransferase
MSSVLRPLIGVTGPARGGHSGWSFTWLGLRRMGARVRRLRPPLRQALLDDLDGVVIGGGAHVEPSRYAQQPSIEYMYDEQRDEFEWAVLGSVLERRLPLLGICRGAQLINVFRGGTLYQNLPEDIPGIHLKRHVLARKRIELVHDSLLEHVMDVHNVLVNSLHRQGVRDLGQGLRISARDEWGIVQAIETAERGGPWLLGVQWHPEYLPAHPAHRRLFRELVVAARFDNSVSGDGVRQRP